MDPSARAELERLKVEQRQLENRLAKVGFALAQEENRLQFAVNSLERLRQDQADLETQAANLTNKIGALERAVSAAPEVPEPAITSEPVPPPVIPAPQPPPIPQADVLAAPVLLESIAARQKESSRSERDSFSSSERQEGRDEGSLRSLPPAQTQKAEPTPFASSKPERGSFEMRLGTYWLVRIGIVMLLSGMVFLGNYAYKNFIGKLGPWGKVTLLYVASGALLGLGTWLGRKQEKLKNYAQVLFAGGLAAVYFTTYAAHHMPTLRVITSPVLDGLLLLGWAGFMVWLATKEKSETLALFAVGLGYYTSIITQVGLFTLYSNVVLTVAAVCFLLRNRWATLTFGSLAATYAAYAFWRFNDQGVWRWASPEEGLWTGAYFLMCYWVIFTAAVFLSHHEHFSGKNRTTFLSLNNGAFFALFLLTMLQVRQGGFWKFALGYGSVLLVLAVAASRWLKNDRLSGNAYLTQGLLLVTLGFISYYTGLKLGLVTAVESVTLFVLAHLLKSRIMFGGSLAAGLLATLCTVLGMKATDPTDLYLGCGVGALLLANNLVKQAREWPSPSLHQFARAFFAIAGSLVFFKTTWDFCPVQYRPAVLALEGLALTLSFYVVKSREYALAGQFFVVVAQMLCITHLASQLAPGAASLAWPWWNTLVVGAVTLGLSHWWTRQKSVDLPEFFTRFVELMYALAFVGLIYLGLKPHLSGPTWLMLLTAFALVVTGYGIATRAWFLAAAAQLFLLGSAVEFMRQLWFAPAAQAPGAFQSLVPLAGFLAMAWFAVKHLKTKAPREASGGIQLVSILYLWAAFALSLGWIFEFVPARQRFWVLSLAGAGLFAAGGATAKRSPLLFSGCYTVAALLLLWLTSWSAAIVYWLNFLGVLLLLVQQQLARRSPGRFQVKPAFHPAYICLGSATLWLLVSKWVLLYAGGFYLTVSWGFLALLLFALGVLLGERTYRWAGLALLGFALGRVVLFDVWKLETIYRIFSFMGLGIVLLVLGFIYNKYQEKIRQWL